MPSDFGERMRGDLASYLLGALEPEERVRFEQLLASEEPLRDELRDLTATVVVLEEVAPAFDAPGDLAERTLARLTAPAPEAKRPRPPATAPTRADARAASWSWPRRFALGGAFATALAAAVFAGTQLSGDAQLESGKLELSGTLVSTGGTDLGTIDVVALGIGRRVEISSEALPILPKGEFYEVWFVAPDDTTANPNRISAGTFHPDEQGRSDLDLKAAVDPALYPTVEITAEPGDGNPAVGGEIVATLEN